MAVHCFTQLIQPGKREEANAIFEEIRGTRRSEYEASRRRLGIREMKVWFQSLPQGDMAVVYWEGDDPRAALQEFASSEDPFDECLKERGGMSTISNRAWPLVSWKGFGSLNRGGCCIMCFSREAAGYNNGSC